MFCQMSEKFVWILCSSEYYTKRNDATKFKFKNSTLWLSIQEQSLYIILKLWKFIISTHNFSVFDKQLNGDNSILIQFSCWGLAASKSGRGKVLTVKQFSFVFFFCKLILNNKKATIKITSRKLCCAFCATEFLWFFGSSYFN